MRRDMSYANALLAFIQGHVARTGAFPTNQEINEALDVGSWRVASMLSHLVKRGDLTRSQIASKGLRHRPKYRYALAGRSGTVIAKAVAPSIERVA
jgi:predicted ArsR family transcriptional regulator